MHLDPSFAAAWAEVANVLVRQAMSGATPLRQASEEARHAADRALTLDAQLPAAYLSSGSVEWLFNWNWLRAEAEFKKAIELEPGNADAYRWAARAATTLGHFDVALNLAAKSIELDPLEVLNYKQIGNVYFRTGRYPQAEAAWSTGRALNPAYVEEKSTARVLTLLAQGEAASALKAQARLPRSNWDNWCQAIAYHALGRQKESDASLARFVGTQTDDSAVEVAQIYAYRGEIAQALTWLNRAYERHDDSLPLIKGDPFLRNLEREPGYKAFLRKMNLPE